jgi:hypothetical protein
LVVSIGPVGRATITPVSTISTISRARTRPRGARRSGG